MAYVRNNNLHRISITRPEGGVPLRLVPGAVVEADGELLDRLVATRGVEKVSKKDYEAHQAELQADYVDADEVLRKGLSGEGYKAPDVQAQEQHDSEYGGPLTAAAVPTVGTEEPDEEKGGK